MRIFLRHLWLAIRFSLAISFFQLFLLLLMWLLYLQYPTMQIKMKLTPEEQLAQPRRPSPLAPLRQVNQR